MTAISPRLLQAERLTLAVLLAGVVSLALSDFVSPVYWSAVAILSLLRLARGPRLALTEMQASLVGWSGFVWVGIELVLGRALVVAFTDFLLILAAAVVIEAATPRNHLHRMLVGLFLVLGAAVLTDSVLYVLPLAAFIWFMWRAAQCLYGMNVTGGDLPMPAWRRDAKVMPWLGFVVLLLFVSVPRFDFHAYLKPVQPRMATSGFSDQVELGDFARELDPTVVLRIEPLDGDVEGFRRRMMGRYWRGIVLNHYSGGGWLHQPGPQAGQWRRGTDIVLGEGSGRPIAVYREASDHAYMMLPAGVRRLRHIPDTMQLDTQGIVRFRYPPSRRVRIEMDVADRRGLSLPLTAPGDAERNMQDVPTAVSRWAKEVAGAGVAGEQLQRLVGEMRGWTYDLQAKIDPKQPIRSFLATRRGHCELYATLLALAARSLGIPARVVNGYYGGEWNETGGFYLIRQQHAHSWVEAWVDGRWQRFDGTPAARWELSGVRFPALDELWEAVRLSWYRYVLEFQDSDRGALLHRLLEWLKRSLPWLAGAVVLTGIIWGWSQGRPRAVQSPQWPVLDRWLVRHGIVRRPCQPLRNLPVPEHIDAAAWRRFVAGWERQAYGGTPAWGRWQTRRRLRALF